MTYTILTKPLTKKQLKIRTECRVDVVVAVELSEIIDNDNEGFLDLLSELAIGSPLLQDIGYHVVGHDDDVLHLRVTGDASLEVDADDED